MENKLWKKIPTDVFINNIMPFVYQTTNKDLLNDIRNFTFDYKMIKNYYFFDLNEYCLLYDIISFCKVNGAEKSPYNTPYLYNNVNNSFISILDRNIIFQNFSLDEKSQFIEQNFFYNIICKTERKIKFLFSLLTPIERSRFLNQCIIEYHDQINN